MLTLKKRAQKGIALVVILLALVILAAVAGGVVTMSSDNLMHSHSGNESLEALYAARAGAWHKLGQIKAGDTNDLGTQTLPATNATYSATVTMGTSTGFPPDGTFYVEATGTSHGRKVRRVGILASLSQSRWNHAAFGNDQVVMKSGSYTDSFNSDVPGAVDHSKASVATNNAVDGIVIEDHKAVVIGWANAIDVLTGKPKKGKKKDGSKTKLVAEANVQGPPGSSEGTVIQGGKDTDQAYNDFETGAGAANNTPVSMPTGLLPGTVGVLDTLSGLNDVTVVGGPQSMAPGAYDDLSVGAGGVAILDVSAETPGSTVQYTFNSIELNTGILQVQQPPPPAAKIKVELYVDTGDGSDPNRGVRMTGSSLVNDSQKPINLQLHIAGQGTNNFLEGHDELKDGVTPSAYYVAYAPEAEITVNRGQIYGSVVAKKVTLDGESLTDPDKSPAVIHYDVTLLDDTGNPPQISVLSVREF